MTWVLGMDLLTLWVPVFFPDRDVYVELQASFLN